MSASDQQLSLYSGRFSPDRSLNEPRDIFVEFNQPITFTRSGLRGFLRNVYSRGEYCSEFLPHSFCHYFEFLEYGKKTEQDILYFLSSTRLFANKVKGVRYVTSYAVVDLVAQLPEYFEPFFAAEEPSLFGSLKKTLVELLYDNFLEKFSIFKQNPDTFFDSISDDMVKIIDGSSIVQKQVDREQLRQTVMRFLEITLSKVIWSPIDQDDVWQSVKLIAKHMTRLKEKDIISQDDLDDLFKSLLERFCHFLDIAGSDLSPDVINKIKEDIHNGNLLMLELDEQEDYIQTKSERLMTALGETEAKIIARSHGIISEVIA